MPLVVPSLGTALLLPTAVDAPPTVLGRSLKHVGVVRDADVRNVSRAQISVSVTCCDASTGLIEKSLVVTAVGANPTPYFPLAKAHKKHLLARGESVLLVHGDGLGLCQTDNSPGPLRFQTDWTGVDLTKTIGPDELKESDAPGKGPATERKKNSPDAFVEGNDEGNSTDGNSTRPKTNPEATPSKKRARAEETPFPETETAFENKADPNRKPIVLVAVGAPGSGKSTFASSLPRKNWQVVNQDTAGTHGRPGTREHCVTLTKKALLSRKNVFVDRCGLTGEQRSTFVKLAIDRNAAVHALWLVRLSCFPKSATHCLLLRMERRAYPFQSRIYTRPERLTLSFLYRKDLPKETLFDRLAKRVGHPTVGDGKGVGLCKRMLGAKANSAPTAGEGFEKVVRCQNEAQVEQAKATYVLVQAMGRERTTDDDGASGATAADEADIAHAATANHTGGDGRAGTTGTSATGPDAATPPPPNAFAAMMGAAKSKKETLSGDHSKQEAAPKRAVTGGTPFWQSALSNIAKNPDHEKYAGVVEFFDEELVVVKDAFPKATTHFLVLARAKALEDGPSTLTKHQVPLLKRMAEKGSGLFFAQQRGGEKNTSAQSEPKIGFHAVPSMKTLHLHILSSDLQGTGMQTRRHWNSFATGFFKNHKDVLAVLETGDATQIKNFWDPEEAERIVKMTPLRCHRCFDGPFQTMPKLFGHLTNECRKR